MRYVLPHCSRCHCVEIPRNETWQRKCLAVYCNKQRDKRHWCWMLRWVSEGADIIRLISSQLWLYPHPAYFIQFLVHTLVEVALYQNVGASFIIKYQQLTSRWSEWILISQLSALMRCVTRPEHDTWRGWVLAWQTPRDTRDERRGRRGRDGKEDHYQKTHVTQNYVQVVCSAHFPPPCDVGGALWCDLRLWTSWHGSRECVTLPRVPELSRVSGVKDHFSSGDGQAKC